MNIGIFFSALVSIAKAVPTVNKWVITLNDMWVDYQIQEYKTQHTLKEHKILALKKAISNAKTDSELVALSIVLNDINQL